MNLLISTYLLSLFFSSVLIHIPMWGGLWRATPLLVRHLCCDDEEAGLEPSHHINQDASHTTISTETKRGLLYCFFFLVHPHTLV